MRLLFSATAATLAVIASLTCPAIGAESAPTESSLRSLATDYQQHDNWLAAAAAWQRVEELNPSANDASRQRVFALSRGGAADLANQLATQRPQLFNQDELYQLAHAAAAQTIGFGHAQINTLNGPQRFAMIDRALQEEAQITAKFGVRNPTRFDTLLALRERERMRDAVDLFETLLREQVDIPPYARIAAGEAYLSLHQPARARDLLRGALTETDPHTEQVDAELALVYAYLESEQPAQALQLIDKLLAATPAHSYRGLRGVEQTNPDYARVAAQAALLRVFTDRLDEAEQRLQTLRALAPFNSDVRLAWATLQNAREHPHAALEDYRLMHIDQPNSIEAVAGVTEILLAQNNPQQAQRLLAQVQQQEPDNRSVERLTRKLALQQQPVLRSEVLIGRGGGNAGAESLWQTSVYSSPLNLSTNGNLRLLAQLSRARGNALLAGSVDGVRRPVVRTRIGAGLDCRRDGLSIDAELNHADGKAAKSGASIALTSILSDSWQVNLSADSNLNTLAAAANQAGITARQTLLGATWSANESRRAGLELARTDFSDGNRRPAGRVWWSERWHSDPGFKFDTLTSYATASNRSLRTPYFNPRHEQELTLSAKAEWLNWRRYERQFKQRLMLQIGSYRQANFNEATLADARYEHEWQLDEALALTYGIGHGFHPYDGVREQRRYGYLNLNWIFR